MSAFEQLGLDSWLAKQCGYMALHQPTPIQARCIPAILQGNHVVGGAPTGSGKTAAFALPILQALSSDVYGVFSLVLTPSRELAYQIADQFIALGAPLRVRTVLVIGGVRHEEQVDALKARPPIVIATPGRLLHLLTVFEAEVKVAFRHLRFLVLDEADRLTEGDMQQSVRGVLRRLLPSTARRQVLMFSATLEPRLTASPTDGRGGGSIEEAEEEGEPCWPALLGINPNLNKVKRSDGGDSGSGSGSGTGDGRGLVVYNCSSRLDGSFLSDEPKEAEEEGKEKEEGGVGDPAGRRAPPVKPPSPFSFSFPTTLKQSYVFIPDMVKLPSLVAALRAQGKEQSTIVFANSCMRAELVRLTLQLLGFPVCSLNSLLPQQHRLDNLALFKVGVARILVATDIASRGLDIPVVSTVMHYDVPKHATTYVHRVGRAARAGHEGTSVAFVTEHDVKLLQHMERKLGITLAKWEEGARMESEVLHILDEVSGAKVQAKQQVSEQFGNRVSTIKQQAVAKKAERRQLLSRLEATNAAPSPLPPQQQQQQQRQAVPRVSGKALKRHRSTHTTDGDEPKVKLARQRQTLAADDGRGEP